LRQVYWTEPGFGFVVVVVVPAGVPRPVPGVT
jgi:hypothetical protein